MDKELISIKIKIPILVGGNSAKRKGKEHTRIVRLA